MKKVMKQLIIVSCLVTFIISSAHAQTKHTLSVSGKEVVAFPSLINNQFIGLAGPVVGIINNQLIVAGGANFPDAMPWKGGKKKYYKELFVFAKKKDSIFSKPVKTELPFSIAYAASCTTPMGIVYAGGENENGISNKVFLIQWKVSQSSLNITSLPDLPEPIANASMTCIGNTIYMVGGESNNATIDSFYSLQLDHLNFGWQTLPKLPKPLSHVVSVIQFVENRKQIFVIGGRTKQKNGLTNFSSDTYSFNIKEHRWVLKNQLPYSIAAGTGIAFSNHSILLFGGDKGDQFNKVENATNEITSENNENKKIELTAIKNQLLATHPGFSKELLLFNTQKNSWQSQGFIPFNTRVTTVAVQWGKELIIPTGEIKAGVRTPKLLTIKISNND
jgi:cyclically-permuted mutarotase family protein